ncbi:hypothetical protein [Streptomyces sp. MP131-18]|uniref:hypothetical protein n=1 Tax=Streptomyces sp. MP131-18 TaxID=1857892 RepID=UPI00097BE0F2|nr:hypothetical protein [Streptomyces sp. MP131-18]ONK12138.1 hypothetical protein STBA_28770 [Streptomyces sp. MP131-18]
MAGSGAPTADEMLLRTLRNVWPALPALLFGSVAVCLASALTVLLAPGITPVSTLLAGLLVAPCAAALAEVGNALAAGREATVTGWWRGLRRLWRFGTAQGLVVAVPVAAFLAALAVWRNGGGAWVLPSLAVSGAVGVLALPALAAVLPLGAARGDLRGRRLWTCGLYLVARWPHRFLAGPALAVLGVWAAVHWTASVLLLVPGPAAVVAAAAVWTTLPDPRRPTTAP